MQLYNVLARFSRGAALAGLVMTLANANAAAPQVKTQAPGYYRMMLGDFEVTALSDGTMDLPVDQLLTNVEPAHRDELLKREYLKAPVETSLNAFLINTGPKLVLIDTGAGSLFGATLGRLASSLAAAGYRPEQVDAVLITHMHGDHVGGLAPDGKPAFPNAVVYSSKLEADYWLSQANMDKAPANAKGNFEGAMNMLKPYIDAGKFQRIDSGSEIAPGIKSAAASGHTPGHNTYVVQSGGHKLVLWGDLIHVAAVQIPEPAVTIHFDSDSNAARAERERLIAEAASQGYWVGIAHVPFPGLGHLRTEGKGYAWVPANYTANRQ